MGVIGVYYWGSIGIMEKKIQATIMGYIGVIGVRITPRTRIQTPAIPANSIPAKSQ